MSKRAWLIIGAAFSIAALSVVSGCGGKSTPAPADTSFVPDPMDTLSIPQSDDVDILGSVRGEGRTGVIVQDSAIVYESAGGSATTVLLQTGDMVEVVDIVDTVRGGARVTMYQVIQQRREASGWVRGRDLFFFDDIGFSSSTYRWSTYVESAESYARNLPNHPSVVTYTTEFFRRCLDNPQLEYMAPRVALANGAGFAVVLAQSTVVKLGLGRDTVLNCGERVIALPFEPVAGTSETEALCQVVLYDSKFGTVSNSDIFRFREDSWNEYIYGTAVAPELALKGAPAANIDRLFAREFLECAASNQKADFSYLFARRFQDAFAGLDGQPGADTATSQSGE